MEVTPQPAGTHWSHGHFGARPGPRQLLFGRTYEDAEIEGEFFAPDEPVFCIAGAGDTAFRLAASHPVVALDINPEQVAYVGARRKGARRRRGTAEHLLAALRVFAPLVGWTRRRRQEFLDLSEPREQLEFWRRKLNTRRFRLMFDLLLSLLVLRRVYAPPMLDGLPAGMGAVLRRRLERGFSRHPNRSNPFARALLLGDPSPEPAPTAGDELLLVCADAAGYLEEQPAGSFAGFSLSNILDGADAPYARRLFSAVQRAATPEARVILRSFREPRAAADATNHAARDRSLIWGIVDVRPAADLGSLIRLFEFRS